MSLSGRERNRLIASDRGRVLHDVSYFSGADFEQDGRVFARADFNRDGAEDIALVSRDAPILRVLLNRHAPASGNHWIRLRVAGNGTTTNRDAVGSTVNFTCGNRTLRRDISSGDGFATQNARALTVGLGDCPTPVVQVRFADGQTKNVGPVAANRAYRLVQGGAIEPFEPPRAKAPAPRPEPSRTALAQLVGAGDTPITYVTFWASWCSACTAAQPRLDAITSEYRGRVDVIGLSVEPDDDAATVQRYASVHRPSFALKAIDARALDEVRALFGGDTPPLPSGVIIDTASGRVLWKGHGVATRSDLVRSLPANEDQPDSVKPVVAFAVLILLLIGAAIWRRKSD